MAILDALKSKKTATTKASKSDESKKQAVAVSRKKDSDNGLERLSHVIIRPRITEKGSSGMGKNAYTFEVSARANKITIKEAVQEIYGKNAIKIRIINMKPKQKMSRGFFGASASFKKA